MHIAAVFNYMSIILRCLSHRTPASSSSWSRWCSLNEQLFILGLCSAQDPVPCSLNTVQTPGAIHFPAGSSSVLTTVLPVRFIFTPPLRDEEVELFLFIDGGLHREMRRVLFFGVTPAGLLGFLCSTHRLPPACGSSGLLHKRL